MPGIESSGRVEEADRPHRLRHIEFDGPHTGSEITVTFEAVGEGTRIVITHAGFGSAEHWDEWLEGTELGWSQAIADLDRVSPHGRSGAAIRCRDAVSGHDDDAIPTRAWKSARVASGGLADGAGLQAGDLLLRVGGVPVFSIAELWVLMREHRAGTELKVEYVRARERCHGRGALTGWLAS